MRALVYNTIKSALESIVDQEQKRVIKHIDLFNHQLDYAEEEQPFETPAVLVEFQPIVWMHQLHGVRDADFTVNLHVITDSRVGKWEDTVAVFELLDTINRTLHGIGSSTALGTMNALTCTQSTTDHNFDELQDNIETYTCHVSDHSAYK